MMKVRTDHGVDHQPEIGVKKTRGKQKIEIKRIENKTRRQVTFSKRREGLFKKCSELGSLHGASVAAIAFSEAGRLFSYGIPTAQSVLERYINDTNNKVEAGECRANWWDDVEIDGLELNELEAFKVSLEGLRKQVDSRIVEIKNAPIIGSDHGFGFDVFDNSSLFTDEDLGVVVQGGGGGGSSLDAQNGYGNRGLGCENFEYGNVNGGGNLGGNQDYFDFRSIINDPSLDADQQASSSRFGYCWLSDNYGMLSQVTC